MPQRQRRFWFSALWKRCVIAVRRIVRLEDTPHRIALGSAIGTLIAWLPLFGIQLVLTMIVARLCRANVLASLPWVFITNPLTIVPFYWAHYRLGLWLMPGVEPVSWERFVAVLSGPPAREGVSWLGGLWYRLVDGFVLLGEVFLPTTVGTAVIGIPVAWLVYRWIYWQVARLQERRQRRLAARRDHEGGAPRGS
ncbi:MAG: DUF2062 domain-containing protein [Planctomycetes bacterium]|nr:DUF2062 domain-containing protein [Planctomycetota bacterium]